MTLRSCAFLMLFATTVLVAGCATPPLSSNAGPDHPAHPDAAASPIPPLETGLLKPIAAETPTGAPNVTEPRHRHVHP